ncbi:MAG: hypothetical protein ACM308_03390, partial [Qipengyuania vulgaris]
FAALWSSLTGCSGASADADELWNQESLANISANAQPTGKIDFRNVRFSAKICLPLAVSIGPKATPIGNALLVMAQSATS